MYVLIIKKSALPRKSIKLCDQRNKPPLFEFSCNRSLAAADFSFKMIQFKIRLLLSKKNSLHCLMVWAVSTEYIIRLKPSAKPYALSAARKVLTPLREKLQAELQ